MFNYGNLETLVRGISSQEVGLVNVVPCLGEGQDR